MEQVPEKHRKNAKVVGCIDAALSGGATFVAFTYIFGLSPWTGRTAMKGFKDFLDQITITTTHVAGADYDLDEVVAMYYWFSYLIDFIVSGSQCIAAIHLNYSANPALTIDEGLTKVFWWLLVNTFVFFGYFIWRIMDNFWITLCICGGLRGSFMYIVWKYTQQMRLYIVPLPKKKKRRQEGDRI